MSDKKISRRQALKTMGGLAIGAALPPFIKSRGDKRPNILFITGEGTPENILSCYGSKIHSTPNIDRIAQEGMKFENSYCSNALCAPSRATLLTGKYSHLNGVPENIFGEKKPFDGSQMTFPQVLQANGYKTACFGKWHLRSLPTGFDIYKTLPGFGRYHDPVLIENGKKVKHKGYITDLVGDFTIDAMKQFSKSGNPFCVMAQFKSAHRGWSPDQKHKNWYKEEQIPVPETFDDDYSHRASPAQKAKMRIANMPDYKKIQPDGLTYEERKDFNYQHFIKDFKRVTASLDENIGRILDYLDESGLAENTVVIYTTDHGFFLGEHGWFDKRFMYEEAIRVPTMIRYPGRVQAGSVNSNALVNIDNAPTVLDFAGITPPSEIQGRSFKPLAYGNKVPNWRENFYYHYYEYGPPHWVRAHYGIRTDRYKLIYYYTVNEWELFDLREDPHELTSLYSNPHYSDIIEELKHKLQQERNFYQDHTGKDIDI